MPVCFSCPHPQYINLQGYDYTSAHKVSGKAWPQTYVVSEMHTTTTEMKVDLFEVTPKYPERTGWRLKK